MTLGRFSECCLFLLCLVAVCVPMSGQSPESYRGLLTEQVLSSKLPGPQHLKDYVADGKLRLSLHDAVLLTLENNSLVRVQESTVETGKFALLRAHAVFDPKLV